MYNGPYRSALLLALLGAAIAFCAPAIAESQSCRAHDAASARVHSRIVQLLTATDPDEIARRVGYGLPAVDSTAVTYVTDSKLCAKAIPVYNATLNLPAGSPIPTKAYVIAVGAGRDLRYVVMAPESSGHGEYVAIAVFDRRWVWLNGFTG